MIKTIECKQKKRKYIIFSNFYINKDKMTICYFKVIHKSSMYNYKWSLKMQKKTNQTLTISNF
jgi:hypothetical protein